MTAPNKPDDGHPRAQSSALSIDLRLLAEKVYRLMLADVRLEKARGAQALRKER